MKGHMNKLLLQNDAPIQALTFNSWDMMKNIFQADV